MLITIMLPPRDGGNATMGPASFGARGRRGAGAMWASQPSVVSYADPVLGGDRLTVPNKCVLDATH